MLLGQPCGNLPQGKTRDVIGDIAGVSGRTLEKAVKIVDAAQENPDEFSKLLHQVDTGKRSIHSAFGTVVNRQKQIELEKQPPVPYPVGKYRAIVIDPPWPIKKIEREVAPNQGQDLPYPIMSLEEIEAIPIQSMAIEEGCHVYLWTTQKYLKPALEIFEKWGVKYQCLMTWLKPGGFTPFSWQYNTEHVLFGQIGNLPLTRMGLKLGFTEKRREHSRKPEIFYQMVQEASPEPRVELFARQPRSGFMVWGNETEHFPEVFSIEVD